ncbi:substrate-binding domain-containing protein [Rhizobium bangladeshense]|uniref:substrate-binding domain-containing protein n=1 Tax=Rhizobium bangladeshense TaxID=1138189 RepID=UPI001C83B5E3|nr:substrate-binding domain-containing protein [Rhizobium bangladeshense]MBX4893279.1 substrate-binding domain-containing protein [Rhizobium bangladeshense]MBX4898786.1 substrate-binding domain-containing protein [Rhizobium bangladeshense]MBY3581662.1 substrate-binding domain-containing protein [Rhizobium bangladeshense]MBY3616917.1 substrate-binding domain-containing protein [Rhizobium bangladeshense]
MTITGLGPHGERAAAPERVLLLPEDMARARAEGLRVAIVLHTTSSDWAKQLLAGLVGTLGACGVVVIDVADCAFAPDAQIHALDRLIREAPDAIISLPVANAKVAEAHKRVAAAGIKLVLLDNAPTGLLPNKDYVSLISADNFGLGKMAAESLSPHLPDGAQVGVLGYDADFFATNEREIAFVKWMGINRPDLRITNRRFSVLTEAASITEALLKQVPELGGLFVVWDTPATAAAKATAKTGMTIPIATIDLGREAAIELAAGGPIVAIAAQQPFRQGQIAASSTVMALLGRLPPAWVALPGVPVTPDNVVESFQTVWQTSAPRELLRRKKLVR